MWQRLKNYYHLAQALLSALFFNFPSKKLTVIGVTGTDGKTTTVNMIYHILKSAGKRVSMVSSVNAQIGSKRYETGFHVSTPSPFSLQKYLKAAVDAKNDYFVLEATSHGLDQNRLAFVDFGIGVLTNITHEHLDYHKSWQNYALAKLKLLKAAKSKIVNKDDKAYSFIKSHLNGEPTTYSLEKNADFNLKNLKVLLKIEGHYNISNALAAAAAASKLKIGKKTILNALSTFPGVEGRLDKVETKKGFDVYVDFAHTPNGLENALTTLMVKAKAQKGRLIAVFGSAGKRDAQKRPLMGKVASELADFIVLTAEDPRREDVNSICSQIAKSIKSNKYKIVTDRKDAITFALQKARKNDIVGLFGKGHEKSMNIDGKELPWDEFKTVKEALRRLK